VYKELNNLLKSYNPTQEEIDQIFSRFNSHSFSHSGDNQIGEEYEVWVYEYLKQWAIQEKSVSAYVAKSGKFRNKNTDSFNYDNKGQLIYLKKGKRIAEFDGLFIYKNKVIFVESSVSELRSYFKKLEERLKQKHDLLVEYFKTEEVYYLLVTRPRKKSLVYRSLPNLVLYKLKTPESFFNNKLRGSEPDSNKLKSIFDITLF